MPKIKLIAGVCAGGHRVDIVLPVTVEKGSDAAKKITGDFLQRFCRTQAQGQRPRCGLPLVGFALIGGADGNRCSAR